MGTGKGSGFLEAFLYTAAKSGSPSPQNFGESTSWWQSRRVYMPLLPSVLTMPSKTYREMSCARVTVTNTVHGPSTCAVPTMLYCMIAKRVQNTHITCNQSFHVVQCWHGNNCQVTILSLQPGCGGHTDGVCSQTNVMLE